MKPRKDRRDWQREDYFWERTREKLLAGAVVAAVGLVVWGVRELIDYILGY